MEKNLPFQTIRPVPFRLEYLLDYGPTFMQASLYSEKSGITNLQAISFLVAFIFVDCFTWKHEYSQNIKANMIFFSLLSIYSFHFLAWNELCFGNKKLKLFCQSLISSIKVFRRLKVAILYRNKYWHFNQMINA